MSRAERGSPNEGKRKWVCSPARGAGMRRAEREDVAGECLRAPMRFTLWGLLLSSLRSAGLARLSERRLRRRSFRHALRGAAGGGLPQFCKLPGVLPLRPASEHPVGNFEFRCSSRRLSGLPTRHNDSPSPTGGGVGRADGGGSRPARVLCNHFPLCNPRAPGIMILS